jgi:16S rRNA (cytidine1402-2'-O)-methyltransferase
MATERRLGTLYVVATPIGNLGDITLRALEVLRSVAVVAAEDTRLTRRIWARHGLETPLVSYHAHSGAARTSELLERLRSGADVALVSDAGTPLVSDPGAELVAAWAESGGRVEAIPGPSAVLAALGVSGIHASRWVFEGFLPRSGRERRERIARLASDERATVLFESPRRTPATLRDLSAACGPDRRAAVCRELTKRHEEVLRGPLGELAAALSGPLRGEVTIVLAGAPVVAHAGSRPVSAGPLGGPDAQPPSLETARARVATLMGEGLSRAAAAKQVAGETGLPRRDLYAPGGDPDDTVADDA